MSENGLDFSGKNILVTGGGGVGIGSGICRVLSGLGATVILNDISQEATEKAAENYEKAVPVWGDITNNSEIDKIFGEIAQNVGPLHGLVNNAGVGLAKVAHEASEDEFDKLYDVDIRGVWRMSKKFVNYLLHQGMTGNIVNISSINAHATFARYAIYTSAKSAVEGLTKGMAVELGPHNIRVNAVGPGYVHAEQNYDLIKTFTDDPDQWIKDFKYDHQAINVDIRPEDCGNAVAFLLSDLSRTITGQTIYVDAGTSNLLYNRFSTEYKK